MKRTYLFAIALLTGIQAFSQDSLHAQTIKTGDSIKKVSLEMFPNPVRNKLIVRLKGFESGIADVKVIDFKGNIVRKENRLLVSADEELVMFIFLKAGAYFLLVNQNQKSIKKKFVVI